MEKNNEVNHPPHYNKGEQEVIEVIEDQCKNVPGHHGFLMGNALKYICRHPFKGDPVKDLAKAMWYLNRLIAIYTAAKVEEAVRGPKPPGAA